MRERKRARDGIDLMVARERKRARDDME